MLVWGKPTLDNAYWTNDIIPYVDVSSLDYVVVRELISLQMK